MSFENKYIFFLCALGVFNCFLVSCYFLFFHRQKRNVNIVFGILTLLLCLTVGKTLYMSFSEQEGFLFCQIGLSASFLIGLVLYYYLKASFSNLKKIPVPWKRYFAFLVLLITGIGITTPYSQNIELWNRYLVWLIYFFWGGYLVLSAFLIRKHITNSVIPSSNNRTIHGWLISVFAGNILIYLAYIIGFFWLYLVEMLTFSFVFYALLVLFLSSKNRRVIFNGLPKKYGASKIDPAEAKTIYENLVLLMDKEEVFKDSNLKLKDLAKRLNITSHKLSQYLNENMGKSFSNYVNQQRINKAIQLLKDNHVYTTEAIGYECGFSSKSVFYSTFKKITGRTPSNFRSQTF